MRCLNLILISSLLLSAVPLLARDHPHTQKVYWQDYEGGPLVGESIHSVDTRSGKICPQALETYRYGPCYHRILQPMAVDHGPIRIRTYLNEIHEVYIPAGYKVLLEPAFVNHHNAAWILPYLYLDYFPFNAASQCAALFDLSQVFKPTPLQQIGSY